MSLWITFMSLLTLCNVVMANAQPPFVVRHYEGERLLARDELSENAGLFMHKMAVGMWYSQMDFQRFAEISEQESVNCDAEKMGMPTIAGVKAAMYGALYNIRNELPSMLGGQGGIRFLVKFDKSGEFVDTAFVVYATREEREKITPRMFADLHAAFDLYRYDSDRVAKGLPCDGVVEYYVPFSRRLLPDFYNYKKGEIISTRRGRVIWPDEEQDFMIMDADAKWEMVWYDPEKYPRFKNCDPFYYWMKGVEQKPAMEEVRALMAEELNEYLPILKMVYMGRSILLINIKTDGVGVVNGVAVEIMIDFGTSKIVPPEVYASICQRIKSLKFKIKNDWQYLPGHNVRYAMLFRDF